MDSTPEPPLLSVRNLRVAVMDADVAARGDGRRLFVEPYGPFLPAGFVDAVWGIDFEVRRGEVVALVGESGSGKTLTAMGALGLVGPGAKVIDGTVDFEGVRLRPTARLVKSRQRWWRRRRRRRRERFMEELLDDEYRDVLGTRIGVLFQEPVLSWAPTRLVGDQAGEALSYHSDLSRDEIRSRVFDALGETQLAPERGFFSFRHELSRGQAQRAMLAATLIKAPSLLVADEPLSGLDAPVAAAILELLRDMQRRRNMAMILITHDLATVASMADRVLVLYGGRVVESGGTDEIFYRPKHPYTEGLLGSIPSFNHDRLQPITGDPPRVTDVPVGRCAFAPRCRYTDERCLDGVPPLEAAGGSLSACVRRAELDLRGVRS